MDTEQRVTLLANHLGIDPSEIEPSTYDETELDAEGATYRILDDDEADAAVVEYVKESLWAFNSDFLADETGLPASVFKALSEQYEDANEAVLAIVEKMVDGGVEEFAAEAASADGRGHFLSGYDGEEIDLCDRVTGLVVAYAYRTI